MLAQMAATAGSVAVGSTIGHGLSNMLFGSSHSAPAAPEAPAPPVQQQSSYQPQGISCEFQAKGERSVSLTMVSNMLTNRERRVYEVPGVGGCQRLLLVSRAAQGCE